MRTLRTLAAILGVIGAGVSAHALDQNAAVSPLPTEPAETQTSQRGPPGTESGIALFERKCTICHGNPAVERAPSPEAVRAMSPDKIYAALGPNGLMAAQGAAASDQPRRAIAA